MSTPSVLFGSQTNSRFYVTDGKPPSSHSKWKRIHEDFVHNWRWGNEIFQFKVKDSLQALSAQSPELRQLPEKSGQIIGPQGVRAAARDVIFEAGDELVLQVLHTFWLLKTMSVCRGK